MWDLTRARLLTTPSMVAVFKSVQQMWALPMKAGVPMILFVRLASSHVVVERLDQAVWSLLQLFPLRGERDA